MAKYRADIDEPRYYPDLGVSVNPADEIDLPDGTVAAGLTLINTPAKTSKKSNPTPDATPAPDSTPAPDAPVSDAPATEGVTN